MRNEKQRQIWFHIPNGKLQKKLRRSKDVSLLKSKKIGKIVSMGLIIVLTVLILDWDGSGITKRLLTILLHGFLILKYSYVYLSNENLKINSESLRTN